MLSSSELCVVVRAGGMNPLKLQEKCSVYVLLFTFL